MSCSGRSSSHQGQCADLIGAAVDAVKTIRPVRFRSGRITMELAAWLHLFGRITAAADRLHATTDTPAEPPR